MFKKISQWWEALNDGLRGYRTFLFSGMVALLGLLDQLDPAMLAGVVGFQNYGYVTMGLAVFVFLLRKVTTAPAGHFWKRGERGTEITEVGPHSTVPGTVIPVVTVPPNVNAK